MTERRSDTKPAPTGPGLVSRRAVRLLAKVATFEVWPDSRGRHRVRWFRTDGEPGGSAGGLDDAALRKHLERYLTHRAANR